MQGRHSAHSPGPIASGPGLYKKRESKPTTEERLDYNCASFLEALEGPSLQDTQRRFDDVFDALEREQQRFDEDLRRLTIAAAYLRELLPQRRRPVRRRCIPRRQQPT
jgi:hypothetical protein